MSLANQVRHRRYQRGWGPDELARRAGVSRTAIYQIESGRTTSPHAGTLLRIARALDVSVERLLAPTEDEVAAAASAPEAEPAGDALEFLDGPAERELERKFHDLLASHLGEGLARLVEDSHRLLPGRRERQIG